MNAWFVIIMVLSITAHLIATMVVGVFAIRRVQYLSLAVIFGMLTVSLSICLALFYSYEETIDVGILHPSIVLPLAASAFLETLYPISFVMPAFLQWQRSVKYAMPVIVVVVGYFIGAMIVGHAPVLHTLDDVRDNLFLVPDVFIRIVALLLSINYIFGMIFLPRRMLKGGTEIPAYMKAYCSWLAITYVFFTALAIHFSWWLLYIVIVAITINNMAFMLQSLEKIAENLPRPVIEDVTQMPVIETQEDAVPQDFNDANLVRFRRAEQYMQTTHDWTNPLFTREQLCEAVGFGRHLLLQSLRSQGYNNVHEYITAYRVNHLRKLVEAHTADSLTAACEQSGFATLVTARSAYKKLLKRDLDNDWGGRQSAPRVEEEA
ncbi:MAG: hypothetical protein HUK01_09000 [Bacteroidaceae bacterium]|nr:hypothetical protein [Bacteroidaceae bacterium]